MKLILDGHDRRFALEQSLLNHFPPGEGGAAHSSLRRGPVWTTASAAVTLADGRRARGRARMPSRDYRLARDADAILKMSFYRAARQLLAPPPWGALSGIRPAGKALALMDGAPGGTVPSALALSVLRRKYDVTPERAALAVRCAERARAARDSLRPREVSLYVGVPFCPTRCAYCSFVSESAPRSGRLIEPYVQALAGEMDRMGRAAARLGLRPRTVYWGGGTPTVLSAAQLAFLMAALRESFDLSGVTEYTVEAGRPDTLSLDRLEALRAGGATRICVNPQTLEEDVLRAVGRAHTAGAFTEAFTAARAAGFPHVNADLIAGLPGDSPEGFARTLERLLALAPDNVTVHTLARKNGSRLTLSGEAGGGAGDVARMLGHAAKRLDGAGYEPYYLYRQKFTAGGFENVGWTKPGKACLYNICMMEELHTVLSLGAGGVTKLVDPARKRVERFFQCKYPLEYLRRCDKIEEHERRLTAFLSAVDGNNGTVDGTF